MFRVCVMAAALAVAVAAPSWRELTSDYSFEQYKADFGKSYSSAIEHAMRRARFEHNREAAVAHNAKGLSWKEGINHMSDWTEDEFNSMLGYHKGMGFASRGDVGVPAPLPATEIQRRLAALPPSVDWRAKGAVTAVKDQGQCGSCWTFATAETLESHLFLQTGRLAQLSEQQIASCSSNPKDCGGTGGCGGGTAEVGYDGIKANKGLASEWVYPYTSHSGSDSTCSGAMATVPGTNITGYVALPSNEMMPLLEAVATKGPIAITVDASSWGRYESGVYTGCPVNTDLDHAVQLVGYGSDNGQDYWLVRNSWTGSWGEDGYIRVARGNPASPKCGVDKTPADGTGCKGGPSQVTTCGSCGILYDNVYPTF